MTVLAHALMTDFPQYYMYCLMVHLLVAILLIDIMYKVVTGNWLQQTYVAL